MSTPNRRLKLPDTSTVQLSESKCCSGIWVPWQQACVWPQAWPKGWICQCSDAIGRQKVHFRFFGSHAYNTLKYTFASVIWKKKIGKVLCMVLAYVRSMWQWTIANMQDFWRSSCFCELQKKIRKWNINICIFYRYILKTNALHTTRYLQIMLKKYSLELQGVN